MINFLIIIIGSAIGFLIASYVHAFIFAKFRADKYEDVLADKIAKRLRGQL